MENSPNLTESTIKDICDELSQRGINFVLTANYYDAPDEDQQPIIAYGVRHRDLSQLIGLIEVSKSYLVNDYNEGNEAEKD